MSARARKTAAFSIPFLFFCAALVWLVQPALAPATVHGAREDEETVAAAKAAEQYVIPRALGPTGGPYRDAEEVRALALRQAVARKAEKPRAESVRFMTYGEAIAWYDMGWSPAFDFYREVYVVSVPGRITVGHHVPTSYGRSYYIYDASTGRLIQWGATDNPDPVDGGRPPRP
ncbi:MAG TPA: hypothetical protein VKJ00_13390 [Thermoanaerobaculia bacterium]|nr:hypothetical protein [Thermoanaerobaculia bacterium]